MTSVFTHIINGDLPGHFVYQDEHVIAIMTIEPIRSGHVLVIPKQEIDHFDDLPANIASHLMVISQKIAKALKVVFKPQRVGMLIAGLEVPHTHIHLVPLDNMGDLDIKNASAGDHAELAKQAELIKLALN